MAHLRIQNEQKKCAKCNMMEIMQNWKDLTTLHYVHTYTMRVLLNTTFGYQSTMAHSMHMQNNMLSTGMMNSGYPAYLDTKHSNYSRISLIWHLWGWKGTRLQNIPVPVMT